MRGLEAKVEMAKARVAAVIDGLDCENLRGPVYNSAINLAMAQGEADFQAGHTEPPVCFEDCYDLYMAWWVAVDHLSDQAKKSAAKEI